VELPLSSIGGSFRLPGRLIGVSRVLLRAPRTLSKGFNIDGLFQCFVLCFNRFFWLFYVARTTSGLVASQAIAQINPVSSLAIALHTLTFNNPWCIKCWYRPHNRFCAFQAMACTAAMSFRNVVVDAQFYAPRIYSTRLIPSILYGHGHFQF
jgi:hypothetical protein